MTLPCTCRSQHGKILCRLDSWLNELNMGRRQQFSVAECQRAIDGLAPMCRMYPRQSDSDRRTDRESESHG